MNVLLSIDGNRGSSSVLYRILMVMVIY